MEGIAEVLNSLETFLGEGLDVDVGSGPPSEATPGSGVPHKFPKAFLQGRMCCV